MPLPTIRYFAAGLGALAVATLCSATHAEDLDTGFRNPPHSTGIRCFWWWLNGNVTAEAITRDLEEMKAKGYSGALIFDADGSGGKKTPPVPAGPAFGSPAWTKLFVHACKEAKRLDLELSLNIQSGWNLGGPEVTEEQSTQHLVWSRATVEGPGVVEVVLPRPVKKRFFRDVVVLAVPLKSGKPHPIEALDLKSSTKELGMSAPDCRPLLDVGPASPDEVVVNSADILTISGKMDPDGKLRWEAPAGKWEVLRVGHIPAGGHVSTHSAGWGGRVIDYLNPAALDDYWKRNVEPLCEAIGPLAGTTLRYIHTDSWEGGGMNWTPGFDKTFRENRGYDLIPWIAVLAGHVVDSRGNSNAFLADFRKTIGDLVANHYGRLAELAKARGMVTHPECSGPHAGPLDGLKNYGRSEELLLTGLAVKDGRLALPSGMRYRVLVLPDHRVLSLGALKKIDALVRGGATVLGPKPLKTVSLEGGVAGKTLFANLADGLWGTAESTGGQAKGIRKAGVGRVAWGMSSRELLREDGLAPDVAVTLKDKTTAPGIDWIHYRIGDAEIYFLAELAGRALSIDAAFRVDGRLPELWDAVDGSIREASTYSSTGGITRVPLELGAYDSLFVVFRNSSPATERSAAPNSIAWQQAQVIGGPWNVSFDSNRGGPAKPVRFETLADWTKHEDPAIKHYSGKAIYRTRFTLGEDLAGKSLALELGEVKDVGMARVKVNGTDLGIVWRPPFRVNLGKSLQPGAHTLEIMVVNSWRNRLIGDASLPEDQRLTKTNVQVTASGPGKWPLEPSGLLGPVILASPTR